MTTNIRLGVVAAFKFCESKCIFLSKNPDFKSIVKIIIKSSPDNGEKKWADIHLRLAIPISDLET